MEGYELVGRMGCLLYVLVMEVGTQDVGPMALHASKQLHKNNLRTTSYPILIEYVFEDITFLHYDAGGALDIMCAVFSRYVAAPLFLRCMCLLLVCYS